MELPQQRMRLFELGSSTSRLHAQDRPMDRRLKLKVDPRLAFYGPRLYTLVVSAQCASMRISVFVGLPIEMLRMVVIQAKSQEHQHEHGLQGTTQGADNYPLLHEIERNTFSTSMRLILRSWDANRMCSYFAVALSYACCPR